MVAATSVREYRRGDYVTTVLAPPRPGVVVSVGTKYIHVRWSDGVGGMWIKKHLPGRITKVEPYPGPHPGTGFNDHAVHSWQWYLDPEGGKPIQACQMCGRLHPDVLAADKL